MYKYFEYELQKARGDLNIYYSNLALEQHASAQRLKSALKLKRIEHFVSFKSTDVVLDFGCGSGAMMRCVKRRAVGVGFHGRRRHAERGS